MKVKRKNEKVHAKWMMNLPFYAYKCELCTFLHGFGPADNLYLKTSQAVCRNCGSTDVEANEGHGEVICLSCGSVLEENKIVESLEFVENNNGAISMVGQFVPSSGNKSFMLSWGIRESREISLQKGYMNIQKIADNLHLPNQVIESAQRIYLMALQRNFTMGRNNSYVAASCLYTICRREKSPIMLIDFSDILQTPIKALGKTFLKLLRLLHISVPNIDPSLFLERFAHKLHLKKDIYKVTYTGIKLIQAMTRDWISTGRRPTGLCGAALLISTRIHGIPTSSNTIANIVRISNPTIIKRISEFKNTTTAKIKVSDFDKMSLTDIPSTSMPPCILLDNKKKFKDNLMQKNKTMSICDTDDHYMSSAKSTCCEENTTEHLPSSSQSVYDVCTTLNEASSFADADEERIGHSGYNGDDSCADLSMADGRSLCSPQDMSTPLKEKEIFEKTNNIEGKEEKDNTFLSKDRINLDEICNDNPQGDDIDNLALKIMNTINLEKNCNILKGCNTPLVNQLLSSTDNAYVNKKNEENIFENEEQPLDNFSIKSTISVTSSINKVSDIESCKTASTILDKQERRSKRNESKSLAMKNSPIHCDRSIRNASVGNQENDYRGCSSSCKSCSTNRASCTPKHLPNGNTFEEDNFSRNGESLDGSYCTTLKETFNSELSNVINDVEEFSFLEFNNDQRKNSSNTNNMNSITEVNNILEDFNYFFENNSNNVNDQTANFDVHSEPSEEQNNEILSDTYDSEIENLILSEKEKEMKVLIWDDMMKNYMPHLYKQLKKQKKRANPDVTNLQNCSVNKKKKKDIQESQSTGDTVLRALEKSDKSLQKKINQDVLKSLFST
ncbi:transcription factor IIIb subunit [Plasmodium ovale curtisi]|uniref:B-related factor 1 n=1 Tax=Plasmodium ovale curtisi TaxID=864141 RepID=A0A1A8XCF2_PLAOA|nr:transcription factor IIIb subunit [Plasmodium ovale curtisi]